MFADGVLADGEQSLRLPHPALANVRVHGQLHLQAQAAAREVHDEQRARELHHIAGACWMMRCDVYVGVRLCACDDDVDVRLCACDRW